MGCSVNLFCLVKLQGHRSVFSWSLWGYREDTSSLAAGTEVFSYGRNYCCVRMLSLSKGWQIFSIQTWLFTHQRFIFAIYNSEAGFILPWKRFNLMLLELNPCDSSAQQMSWRRDIFSVWKSSVFIQLDAYQLFSLNPQHRWKSPLGVTTLILLNMKPNTDESSLLFQLKSLETIRGSFHWELEEWCWIHDEDKGHLHDGLAWLDTVVLILLIYTVNIYFKKPRSLVKQFWTDVHFTAHGFTGFHES